MSLVLDFILLACMSCSCGMATQQAIDEVNRESEQQRFSNLSPVSECPITMEPFKVKVVLPCQHSFEYSAINQVEPKRCPLCRRDF